MVAPRNSATSVVAIRPDPLPQIGLFEAGACQRGIAQTARLEHGFAQIGLPQIGLAEIEMPQALLAAQPSELGAGEQHFLAMEVDDPRIGEVGARQLPLNRALVRRACLSPRC
jgi:hypothetical protein